MPQAPRNSPQVFPLDRRSLNIPQQELFLIAPEGAQSYRCPGGGKNQSTNGEQVSELVYVLQASPALSQDSNQSMLVAFQEISVAGGEGTNRRVTDIPSFRLLCQHQSGGLRA